MVLVAIVRRFLFTFQHWTLLWTEHWTVLHFSTGRLCELNIEQVCISAMHVFELWCVYVSHRCAERLAEPCWTSWTFCLRRPVVTDDVFVYPFELLHFVFLIARSSHQLLQYLHAKANCLAHAGSAAIPVHLHPRPSVTVEAHSFLRPVLRYCVTPITFFFHSRLKRACS